MPGNAAQKQAASPQWEWMSLLKYICGGYFVITLIAGLNLTRGVTEIASGAPRTDNGWAVIFGVILIVVLFIAFAIADSKSGTASKAGTPPPSPPVAAQRMMSQTPARQPEKPAMVAVDLAVPVAKPEPKVRPAEQAAFRNLQNILVDYGQEVISNQTQCERLLSERCADTKREGVVLVAALRENLPQRLLKLPATSLSNTALRNYSAELSQSTGLDESAAQFAVESWAKALGLQLKGA
jgi:hypothetical protein